jgi:hypothetical protein
MPINWGLAQGNGALEAFQVGNALGSQLRQRREQDQAKNALTAYAQNPSEQSLNALFPHMKPEQVFSVIQKRQEGQQQQQKQRLEQVGIMGKLLADVPDDTVYQQRLALARQYGIDTTNAPPSFDAPWIANMQTMVRAVQEDGGEKISGIARELVDAGFQPGTPQFNQAMQSVISNKYSSDYVDEAGNVRRRSALNLEAPAPMQAPAPAQQAGPVVTAEQFRGAVNGLGPQGAAGWAQRNKVRVKVASPEEARQLPSGTLIILPDNSEGRVP